MISYIGLDAQSATCTAVVVNEKGAILSLSENILNDTPYAKSSGGEKLVPAADGAPK